MQKKKKKSVYVWRKVGGGKPSGEEAPIKTFQPLKNHHSICLGNHTMVEKDVQISVVRGIGEKLIINAWKKIILVTKNF